MVSIIIETSPKTRGGRRGGGAVGQGHTRYDCKITARVVTNQGRENTPTGGREALWGPQTRGEITQPGSWGIGLGKGGGLVILFSAHWEVGRQGDKGRHLQGMWDVMGMGMLMVIPSITTNELHTIRGSCLFVKPVPSCQSIDRQLIDYRRLEFPPQDLPAIGKSDHPDGCD